MEPIRQAVTRLGIDGSILCSRLVRMGVLMITRGFPFMPVHHYSSSSASAEANPDLPGPGGGSRGTGSYLDPPLAPGVGIAMGS